MIYAILFWEFFQIGLFAIGGGLVTVPFLFDLSEKHNWYSAQELADMIAVSQSTPGPIGINMATYAGFSAGGISGSITATLSLVLPSVIVVYAVARALEKFSCNPNVEKVLKGIRPAVLALILFAGGDIAKVSITNYKSAILFILLLTSMRFYKKTFIYIIASALIGIGLQL